MRRGSRQCPELLTAGWKNPELPNPERWVASLGGKQEEHTAIGLRKRLPAKGGGSYVRRPYSTRRERLKGQIQADPLELVVGDLCLCGGGEGAGPGRGEMKQRTVNMSIFPFIFIS